MGDNNFNNGNANNEGDGSKGKILPTIADSATDTFLKRFRVIEKIGEGSYSEVLKCKNKDSGVFVACKRLKHVYKSWNQVNDIAEVTTLRTLTRHPHILQMLEIHYDVRQGKVSLIFEIMDMNLYEMIKDRKKILPENIVRLLMFQLMKALRHLHKYGVFHRDIKPENILVRTKTNVLKLGDLGSVRGIYSQPPFTEYISTRWYRSPECLLTAGQYGFKMDIWAAGCVFYEILTLQPLFPGHSEIDQINRIHTVMGPPPHKTLQKFFKFAEADKDSYRSKNQQSRWDAIQLIIKDISKSSRQQESFNGKDKEGLDRKIPTYISAGAKDLVKLMLTYDPEQRPSSQRIINHPYFQDVRDFKVPESEIVKSPISAVFGDEFGRTLISQYYGHVDLKTLGDKSHIQKRVKMKFSQPQKQETEKLEIPFQKSSPLLHKSPETPERTKLKELNNVLVHKKQALSFKSQQQQQLQEIDSPRKKSIKIEKSSNDRADTFAVSPTKEAQEPVVAKPLPHKKPFQSAIPIPDTFAARKRQVLAGNLPPSALNPPEETTTTAVETLEIPKTAVIVNSPAINSKVCSIEKPSPQFPLPANNSNSFTSKIINHKLTPEELKKINETRHLLQMEPLGGKSTPPPPPQQLFKPFPTPTATIKNDSEQTETSTNSPYVKPPNELSPAARKKLLIQKLKQQATKKQTQQNNKSLKIHENVPPQVAAAALKYQTQAAAAAAKARETIQNELSAKSSSFKELPNGPNNKASPYSFAKSNFGFKRITIPADDATNTKPALPKKTGTPTNLFKTPLLTSALSRKLDGGPQQLDIKDISQTLELDKQSRLVLKAKELKFGGNKSPFPNKKPLLSDNIKDINNGKVTTTSKPSGTQTQSGIYSSHSSAAGNMLFPRNRFGTDNNGKPKAIKSTKPNFLNGNNSPSKARLGLAYQSMVDRLNGNGIETTSSSSKPPLPPKYSGPVIDRAELSQKVNYEKEVRIAQILANNSNITQKYENQSLSLKKTFGVFNETEAGKRRVDRIRTQLRDEVYCSSDDDIVSTMRHKLDILISERARRANVIDDEDEENSGSRLKFQKPRKISRKEVSEKDQSSTWSLVHGDDVKNKGDKNKQHLNNKHNFQALSPIHIDIPKGNVPTANNRLLLLGQNQSNKGTYNSMQDASAVIERRLASHNNSPNAQSNFTTMAAVKRAEETKLQLPPRRRIPPFI